MSVKRGREKSGEKKEERNGWHTYTHKNENTLIQMQAIITHSHLLYLHTVCNLPHVGNVGEIVLIKQH